ncbi:hypothetical protein BU26DRAFT_519429 [Trematosphaeria pertusa]|uniref:Ricin B lectin domain-containing protein n=1 Tax=Trematosphaeria pertusa TaxID=390896 RepID=A0A6A6IFU8_9PLEO|nr:uncharacterized protein BU26DRAFT_519429 [Trematosphaeria pertusa]KAF2249311.1 hypothetical protein BU26DRAFT_519429 [Trematosphaeria pertusa]
MVQIDLSAKYLLTSEALGSSKALASTGSNDSLLIEPTDSGDSQLWYFTPSALEDHFRLHTIQKGDFAALDVYNYNGRNSLDLHFYANQELTGQYWRVDDWGDGSVRLSNNFTGPDIHLEVNADNWKLTLAGGDTSGQHWTLSLPGETSTAATSRTPGPKTSFTTNSTGSCTSSCSATATSGAQNDLSKAQIGGIAGGSVAGALLVAAGAIFWWQRSRRRAGVERPRKEAMRSNGRIDFK